MSNDVLTDKGPNSESKSMLGNLFSRTKNMREFTLILIILGLFVTMSFASPYFLTWANMKAMLLSFSTEGIVVVGMTLLIIVGGIDLSVGAVMCLAMVFAAKLFIVGMDPWLASLASIIMCGGIGYLMGLCVTKIGLHHFIVTLAFMGLARGLSMIITQARLFHCFPCRRNLSSLARAPSTAFRSRSLSSLWWW